MRSFMIKKMVQASTIYKKKPSLKSSSSLFVVTLHLQHDPVSLSLWLFSHRPSQINMNYQIYTYILCICHSYLGLCYNITYLCAMAFLGGPEYSQPFLCLCTAAQSYRYVAGQGTVSISSCKIRYGMYRMMYVKNYSCN